MTSSILRIILTSCVASKNCCCLPISVSNPFCFFMSIVPLRHPQPRSLGSTAGTGIRCVSRGKSGLVATVVRNSLMMPCNRYVSSAQLCSARYLDHRIRQTQRDQKEKRAKSASTLNDKLRGVTLRSPAGHHGSSRSGCEWSYPSSTTTAAMTVGASQRDH